MSSRHSTPGYRESGVSVPKRGRNDERNYECWNRDGYCQTDSSSKVDRRAKRRTPFRNPDPIVQPTVIEQTTPPVVWIVPLRFVHALLIHGEVVELLAPRRIVMKLPFLPLRIFQPLTT